MKRSTYIWSLLVGCVAFATSCDLTENVQVKADKSMIFGSKSGLELYSNSFYKALPTLKNGFMQDKMCDVGAVSNTDTFIKEGAYNTETATSWSWGALKNVNYFIDGCNDPKYCTVEAETRDNYLGIARWFRAWFYYDKLTTYGEVPWFPNDIQSYQNDVMYKDRDSRDVIIRNLIADLDFAYEHIQATSSTGSATLTRWAAAALKSRVCLFEAAYRRYHNLTGLEITPEELYREAAKAAKLVIDNTYSSPYVVKPLTLGADVVVHSLTKYINGHFDAIGGAVIADKETIERARFLSTLIGGSLAPFVSWLILRGTRSFELRLEKQNRNAIQLAAALEANPLVEKVYHPSLESHPHRELALRLFRPEAYGAMLSFSLPEDPERIDRFMAALKMVGFANTLGGFRTTVAHPATQSHSSLTPEERAALGIHYGTIRVSVGIESPEDIIRDFSEAIQESLI